MRFFLRTLSGAICCFGALALAPALYGAATDDSAGSISPPPVRGALDGGAGKTDSLSDTDRSASSIPAYSIVVIAPSPTAQPSGQSVRTADEYSGKYADLPSVLETETGVNILRTGAQGDYAEASVRGLSSGQVGVFLDGIPLAPVAGEPVDLSKIPLNLLQRIEIYKTGIPLALMGDGLGSAINLSTDSVGKHLSGQVSIGSFGSEEADGFISLPTRSQQFIAAADFSTIVNNFPYTNINNTPYNPTDYHGSIMTDDDFTERSVMAEEIFKLRNGSEISALANFVDFSKGLHNFNYPDSEQHGRQNGTMGMAILRSKQIFSPSCTLSLSASGIVRRNELTDTDGLFGYYARRVDNVSPGIDAHGVFELSPEQGMHCEALLGGGYDGEILENYRDFNYPIAPYDYREIIEAGIGLAHEWDAGQCIAIRYLHRLEIDHANGDFPTPLQSFVPGEQNNVRQLPHLEADYQWRKSSTLSFDADASYHSRNPTFEEKFGESGSYLGNPNLVPETRYNGSVGIDALFHGLQNRGSLIAGETFNRIIALPNSQGVFRPENYANVVTYGMELYEKLKLFRGLSIDNSLTVLDNTFHDLPDPELDGKKVPFQPPVKDEVSLIFSTPSVEIEHSLLYTAPYFVSTANLAQQDSPLLANIRVTGTLFRNLAVTGRIDNYLNEQNYTSTYQNNTNANYYATNYEFDFIQPGRSFSINLTYQY
jgi:iron complex outermembrane receptor protein